MQINWILRAPDFQVKVLRVDTLPSVTIVVFECSDGSIGHMDISTFRKFYRAELP